MDKIANSCRAVSSGPGLIRLDLHTVRFTTKADLEAADNAELVFWVISTRVMEAFWSSGETFPDRVIVDTVLP